jgi:two-component system, LytTR family, response regulator
MTRIETMRVLIVDDEPLSRTALATVLSHRNDVTAFDMAEDAAEALEYLSAQNYDVMLLDIHMPELTGFELVDQLRKREETIPAIIFVTAHQEHAVAAFEKKAVDYVLKPFAEERVHEALEVALRRSKEERAARLVEMLPHLAPLLDPPARIAIKVKGRIVFVDPSEIVAAEANGNYVLLQQRSGSFLLRESLSVVAEKLQSFGFIRIHRSALVNTAFVETIEPCVSGEYLLRTKTGKEYNVTRTYKDNLKALAKFWIGSDTFGRE